MIKLPPQYVNLPAFLIYSDIPEPIITTAARIYGLAWNINRQHSPEDRMHAPVQFTATLDDLLMVCHIGNRTLRGHLSVLSVKGVLRYAYSKRFNVYTFTLPPRSEWPSPSLDEKSAEICRHPTLVVDDLFQTEDQQQQSSFCIEGGYGGEDEECGKLHSSPGAAPDPAEWERRLACLDVLGIREPVRSELAAGDLNTSEYLFGWVGDRQRHPERGPGHYVLQIRAGVPAPDRCGGWKHPGDQYGEEEPGLDEENEPAPPDALAAELPRDPSVTEDVKTLWFRVLGELQLQMTQATYDAWLRGTDVVRADNHTLTVTVKSGYAKDWLENRLQSTIARTLARLAGAETAVEFVVGDEWRRRHETVAGGNA
ncbi:MAG: hypothetical protein JXA14_26225 [Anaerolineae bacterium]|nr:hypothetical protein [Anaerolineae bacterium]